MVPEVSVLIPAYNAQTTIFRCLSSIIHQSERRLEIIVVNDGSSDKTAAILNMIKMMDSRVIIIHQKNQGVASARNRALHHAVGKWLLFVDSDDELKPNAIHTLLENARRYKSDLVIGGHCVSGRHLSFDVVHKQAGILNHDKVMSELLKDRTIKNYCWGKLILRELMQDVKFKTGHVFEDVDLIAKIIHRAACISVVSEVLYVYRVGRKGSISNGLKPEVLMDMMDGFEAQNHFIISHYPYLIKESYANLRRCYLLVMFSCIRHGALDSKAFMAARYRFGQHLFTKPETGF